MSVITCKDRSEWLAERRNGIGGSDAVILWAGQNGLEDPYRRSLRHLFESKVNDVDLVEETEPMEWGSRLESVIAQAYQDKTGRELSDPGDFTIYTSDENPVIRATPDRFIGDDGILEMKNVGAYKGPEWNNVPLWVVIQVHHTVMATGRAVGAAACLIGGQKFFYDDVDINDAFMEEHAARCASFWDRIKNGDPPEVDDSESTLATLKKIFPKSSKGKIVTLGEEFLAYDQVRLDAIKAQQDAEAVQRFAESKLREAMGDAEIGQLPDGTEYTLKTTRVKGYTREVEAYEYRKLNRRKAK